MGSSASGNRRPSRLCTDQVVAVDVRALSRAGALRPGTAFELSVGGAGVIAQCRTMDPYAFEVTLNGDDCFSFERISLARTPCHLGGFRSWAVCASCTGRVGVLYIINRRFVCRRCADLRYRSQRESDLDRLGRKLQRTRAALSWQRSLLEPLGGKPERMHWRTYANAVKAYRQQEFIYFQRQRRRLGRG